MNYASILIFLVILSLVNLAILISVYILDLANVVSRQKIIFIRTALTITIMTTLIFCIAQVFYYHGVKIILPVNIINRLPVNPVLTAATQSSTDWTFYLLIAYSAGLFTTLSKIVLSYFKAVKQLSNSDACRIQGHLVFLSKNIQTPMSFGLLKAKIYLPFNIHTKLADREIEMCLAHEQIHINQNDFIWKLLSLIVQALLFFAPWVWLLHRKFELEMEIFCDTATRIKTNASIQEYGGLLLSMASNQSNHFIFTNIQTPTLIRRVLAMKEKSTHRPFLQTTLSLILLFTGGTAIATSNVLLMDKSMFKITSKIFIDGNLVSSPQIVTYANQKASITLADSNGSQRLKISLIANDIPQNKIKVSYDIQYRNGHDSIQTQPVMILVPGKEAVINIVSNSGHSYELKVIAKRQ